MKIGLILFFCWATVVAPCHRAGAASPLDSDSILYRHHSVGSASFLQATQGIVFQKVWQLPEAEKVRAQLEQALSQTMLRSLAGVSPTVASNLGPVTASLVADVIEQETLAEIRGPDGNLEGTLAIKLPEARREAWAKALTDLAKASGLGESVPGEWQGFKGASFKSEKSQLLWSQAGDWLLVGLGAEVPKAWPALLDEIKANQRPSGSLSNDWLAVTADLERIRKTFPLIPEFMNAVLRLSFKGRGEHVRTDATFQFPQPLNWQPEPWNLPTNFVRDPIVGFSAVRGIEPLLRQTEEAKLLNLPSYPNQGCAWSLGVVPYLLIGAVPQTGVSNLLWSVLPRLPSVITNHGDLSGTLSYVSNYAGILWQGMPFMTPTLKPIFDGEQEFLMGSMAPAPLGKRHPPPELFGFLSKTNLAFYEWEITQERVSAWRKIYQATLLGFLRVSPVTNAATFRLMEALSEGKLLGNTVSEITVTGPSELTLMRQGDAGLTGFEIVSLLRWLDSAHFPFTFDSAPQMDFKKMAAESRARRATNGPATPRPHVIPPMPTPRPIPSKLSLPVPLPRKGIEPLPPVPTKTP